MPMTKAEKALIEDLRAKASLTLPPYEKPSPVPLPEQGDRVLRTGWFMNSHDMRATLGCSNGYSHSSFSVIQPNTQGPGTFYETEVKALRAMRWELTERVMKELGKADAMIADAERRAAE